jgi:hypothetical protein
MISPFLIVMIVIIEVLVMLLVLWTMFSELIVAEFVETCRYGHGRRIREATAIKLLSAGLPPGIVVFATDDDMEGEPRKREVFLIQTLEDYTRNAWRYKRFYKGKASMTNDLFTPTPP